MRRTLSVILMESLRGTESEISQLQLFWSLADTQLLLKEHLQKFSST